jgi:hypothetical protein
MITEIRQMFEAMTVPALREIAKRLQIGRLSQRRKAELIDTIEIMYVVDQERALELNSDPAKCAVMVYATGDPHGISVTLTLLAIDQMRGTLASRGVDTTGMLFHDLGNAVRATDPERVAADELEAYALDRELEQAAVTQDRERYRAAAEACRSTHALAVAEAEHEGRTFRRGDLVSAPGPDGVTTPDVWRVRELYVPVSAGREPYAGLTLVERPGGLPIGETGTALRLSLLMHVQRARPRGLDAIAAQAVADSGAVLKLIGERVGEDVVPLDGGADERPRWAAELDIARQIAPADDCDLLEAVQTRTCIDPGLVLAILRRLEQAELERTRSRATLLRLRAQMVLSA